MPLLHQLDSYIAKRNDPLENALERLNSLNIKSLIVVDDSLKVLGTITDGDIRRCYLYNNEGKCPTCYDACNKSPIVLNSEKDGDTDPRVDSSLLFPIVNAAGVLKSAYWSHPKTLNFGRKVIGSRHSTYVIGEIGNNHNGSFSTAIQLIDACKEAGVDCVKLQTRSISSLYRESALSGEPLDLGVEYTIDVLKKYNLSFQDQLKLIEYAKEIGLDITSTPWDLTSAEFICNLDLPFIKVASADMSNYSLLETLVKAGKPIVVSTGMSHESDILKTRDFLYGYGAHFAFLHTNSTYPTPFEDINLNYIHRLKEIHPIVGYSGHERGVEVSLAAAVLGASIIERHVTLDKTMEGPDHYASLTPNELTNLVSSIRNVEQSLGSSQTRQPSQAENLNYISLGKSLCAACDLEVGQKIDRNHITLKSPVDGMSPLLIDQILGKYLVHPISEGMPLKTEYFEHSKPTDYSFDFSIEWGIPVRFHDADRLTKNLNNTIIEYHLSYKDLQLDPSKYINNPTDILPELSKVVIHSPELFADGHLLDLASDEANYRTDSLDLLKRVVSLSKYISRLHRSSSTEIVVNVGGWSTTEFIDPSLKKDKYNMINQSLNDASDPHVEFLIQTMPPNPWHFGGQRFHNLFVCPDETVRFCQEFNKLICLDLSHTALACNFLEININDAINKLLPFTSHLHISDASGINQEGLQIGDGDLDFTIIMQSILRQNKSRKLSFIPEIWQGHKNNGEGSLLALERLYAISKNISVPQK